MRKSTALTVFAMLLLSACANTTAMRSDCGFMLPSERERCMRANANNRKALEERRDAQEAARPSAISLERLEKEYEESAK